MAEREAGRPLSDTLSTEEADRLSERFRPSWEPDPPSDPPTIPRAQPAPIAKPILKPGGFVPKPAPESPSTKAAELVALAKESERSPTLVGIQPTIPVGPRSPDDLDWELPTNPGPAVAPERADTNAQPRAGGAAELEAVSVEVEELPAGPGVPVEFEELPSDAVHTAVEEPPASKPSGIGQTYVPKEQGAPAIVLKDDVRAAEEQARAALEAQHRSRRAPTIARMRVVDIPIPTPPADDLTFPAPKRKTGLWVTLFACVVIVAGGAVLLSSGGSSRPEPSVAKQAEPERVRPENTAPPPPAPTVTQAPVEPAVAVIPSGAAAAEPPEDSSPGTPSAKSPSAPEVERPAKPAAAKPTKGAAAAATQPATPAKTSSKPAAKSGSKVIVRETPF
jgi:hypothetical protein